MYNFLCEIWEFKILFILEYKFCKNNALKLDP